MIDSLKLLPTGSPAPDFNYREADGTNRNTRELRGSAYLVYFYPKDNTPGCTTEACSFRDHFDEFNAAGLKIIGVSPDSETSHSKFRTKFELPFALASDSDHSIATSFGVWGKKKFMGREYEGVHRISFLVDSRGHIRKTYPKVDPKIHAGEILNDLNSVLN